MPKITIPGVPLGPYLDPERGVIAGHHAKAHEEAVRKYALLTKKDRSRINSGYNLPSIEMEITPEYLDYLEAYDKKKFIEAKSILRKEEEKKEQERKEKHPYGEGKEKRIIVEKPSIYQNKLDVLGFPKENIGLLSSQGLPDTTANERALNQMEIPFTVKEVSAPADESPIWRNAPALSAPRVEQPIPLPGMGEESEEELPDPLQGMPINTELRTGREPGPSRGVRFRSQSAPREGSSRDFENDDHLPGPLRGRMHTIPIPMSIGRKELKEIGYPEDQIQTALRKGEIEVPTRDTDRYRMLIEKFSPKMEEERVEPAVERKKEEPKGSRTLQQFVPELLGKAEALSERRRPLFGKKRIVEPSELEERKTREIFAHGEDEPLRERRKAKYQADLEEIIGEKTLPTLERHLPSDEDAMERLMQKPYDKLKKILKEDAEEDLNREIAQIRSYWGRMGGVGNGEDIQIAEAKSRHQKALKNALRHGYLQLRESVAGRGVQMGALSQRAHAEDVERKAQVKHKMREEEKAHEREKLAYLHGAHEIGRKETERRQQARNLEVADAERQFNEPMENTMRIAALANQAQYPHPQPVPMPQMRSNPYDTAAGLPLALTGIFDPEGRRRRGEKEGGHIQYEEGGRVNFKEALNKQIDRTSKPLPQRKRFNEILQNMGHHMIANPGKPLTQQLLQSISYATQRDKQLEDEMDKLEENRIDRNLGFLKIGHEMEGSEAKRRQKAEERAEDIKMKERHHKEIIESRGNAAQIKADVMKDKEKTKVPSFASVRMNVLLKKFENIENGLLGSGFGFKQEEKLKEVAADIKQLSDKYIGLKEAIPLKVYSVIDKISEGEDTSQYTPEEIAEMDAIEARLKTAGKGSLIK